jgi:hypothetical protein
MAFLCVLASSIFAAAFTCNWPRQLLCGGLCLQDGNLVCGFLVFFSRAASNSVFPFSPGQGSVRPGPAEAHHDVVGLEASTFDGELDFAKRGLPGCAWFDRRNVFQIARGWSAGDRVAAILRNCRKRWHQDKDQKRQRVPAKNRSRCNSGHS